MKQDSGWHSFEPVLRHVLKAHKPDYIVEWGPGESTQIMLQECPDAHILSIEHDRDYFLRAQQRFCRNDRLHFSHRPLEIKPCGSDGYVTDPLYRLVMAIHEGLTPAFPDLFFIDGRLRNDCLGMAYVLCSWANALNQKEPVVILHDSHRERYQGHMGMFADRLDFKHLRTTVLANKPLSELIGSSMIEGVVH